MIKMKRTTFIIFLLLGNFLAIGQDYLVLKGQTRDSTLASIAFANVIVMDTATNEMEGFAVTDVRGNFQIGIKKGQAYELQVTYIGYTPYKKMIQLDESNEEPFVIILKESVDQLEQVTVVAQVIV